MSDIIPLPDNLIGPADQVRLKSYAVHAIEHGWATRYCWSEANGDPRFDIFRGGADEELAVRIGRHRDRHEFFAEDKQSIQVAAGTLDHVMATLDRFLSGISGDIAPTD